MGRHYISIMRVNKSKPEILICDDDTLFHLAVKKCLKDQYDCFSAHNGDEALKILKTRAIAVLILDVQMRQKDEGLRYLPIFKDLDPGLAIIMSSGRTDFTTVREALTTGASDYIAKDFSPEELALTLARTLERKNLVKRNSQQNFEVLNSQKRNSVLIGQSAEIQEIKKRVDKFRASDANVLIVGETGTGKEVVARQLRGLLPDGSVAPFVAIDSSTIQSLMAESILFGHEKGAFTGAEKSTRGIFEEADGGVVYFDEISNMSLDIQAKLLRVIQEKEISRLGSSKTISLDFRVVCATNQDLENLVKEGRFKADLFQRLNVLPIVIPPLRERRGDIPLLINHFLAISGSAPKKYEFSAEAIALMVNYNWPGNIRELQNVIAFVCAMVDLPTVEVSDLPPKFRDRIDQKPGQKLESFYQRIASVECEMLKKAFETSEKNISQMALTLGMDRSHLYTKLKEHGIHPSR